MASSYSASATPEETAVQRYQDDDAWHKEQGRRATAFGPLHRLQLEDGSYEISNTEKPSSQWMKAGADSWMTDPDARIGGCTIPLGDEEYPGRVSDRHDASLGRPADRDTGTGDAAEARVEVERDIARGGDAEPRYGDLQVGDQEVVVYDRENHEAWVQSTVGVPLEEVR
ncbi:MAG: hypothetical protein ABEI97_01465 [Candidatus Nanohaloarchaea archaeon]